MTAKVVMYSKTTCPYCHRAERLLRERGVSEIEMIQIDIDRSRRDEMIKRAKRSTVPQIFIDDRHVGGCDDLHALEADQAEPADEAEQATTRSQG